MTTYLTITGKLVVALCEWRLHSVAVQVPAGSVSASKYNCKLFNRHWAKVLTMYNILSQELLKVLYILHSLEYCFTQTQSQLF